MNPTNKKQSDLRQRAEQIIAAKKAAKSPITLEDFDALFHELSVHQVELEMQNAELRRVQLEVEKSRNEFWRLYNFAPVGYVSLDEEGLIVKLNQKFANMLDQKKEKLVGRSLAGFMNQEHGDLFHLHLRDALNTGIIKEIEVKFRTDHTFFWGLLHGEKIQEPEKNKYFFNLAIIDNTEARKLKEDLFQAHKMEAIGTLAGGIAHDFNNILGIILGNTELSLEDLPEGNPAHSKLAEIHKACLRAGDVVRQLLRFSRKSEQQKKNIKIAPIIKEMSQLLRSSIPTCIDIRLRIKDDLGTIQADPTQIHQVILNLCTNAADAMAEQEGVLEISLNSIVLDEHTVALHKDLSPGPYIKLSVSDTGQGIRPEEISKVFDPYFTTKDVGQGTGLGLSVVHGIVKKHMGEVSIHSELGKGTTVEVLFPLIEQPAEAPPAEAEKISGGNEAILFVDDEKAIVELAKKGLERLGYQVETNTSARSALALFRSNPDRFDLVISDTIMPEMTGGTLAKEIMKIRPSIPFILCTGHSRRISEDKARDMGISAFVMKPISFRELAKVIRQVLEQGAIRIIEISGDKHRGKGCAPDMATKMGAGDLLDRPFSQEELLRKKTDLLK